MYNQEDDVHYASLTVRQTLQFAIEMRIPGSLPSGLSDGQFKEMVMRTLLKMFNLEHVADMPVGGEAIRGISGGEKKRLSIAEMMVTSAAICGWDNSTRGLDSSNALEFVKCLRILTNLYKTSVVVSLSQANENMYQHFDKVLVMEEGRQLYFGSKQDAVAYFESLGFKRQMRQASADFLVSCTDPIIRHLDPQNLSYDSQSLEILFEKSPESKQRSVAISSYREQLLAQKEKWRYFETAVQNSKHRHTAKRSVYIMPFYRQVWVLMRRQFLIRWQDKLSLVMSLFTTIVVALLLGSLWFDLPHSLSGAFTRSGLLFLLLVYNGFRAFAELGTIFGRPIVKKHRGERIISGLIPFRALLTL
jgi:ATP-binding cassette subfamily G (WHITE) protein 2 (SNQ2)